MAEATRKLEFLIQEHGFTGPEITQDGDYPLLIRVSYHRSDLDLQESLVLSYGGEETVTADVVRPGPTTPYHQAANRARETARGASRHGSCGMGIGETASYAAVDKIACAVGASR